MPRTHTDDLTFDCHSSIRTHTDEGGPRTLRLITVGYCRSYNAATAHYIGSAIAARYVKAGDVGGFHLLPFRVSPDIDVYQPSSVRILVNPLQNATTNGQKIHLILQKTHVCDGLPPQTASIGCLWSIPDYWTTADCNVVLIDNGNGRTFEGGTFSNGDTVGFRLMRFGSDPADTFDKAVRIAECVQFEYTARQS